MGNSAPRICMCGKKIEENSPSRYICLLCTIKEIEASQSIEKARKKCYCGNEKNVSDSYCVSCKTSKSYKKDYFQ
jgi:hypothetical protein